MPNATGIAKDRQCGMYFYYSIFFQKWFETMGQAESKDTKRSSLGGGTNPTPQQMLVSAHHPSDR